MSRGLYTKLAVSNIRKNKNTFGPFILSGMIMTAMFYMLAAIRMQCMTNSFSGAASMGSILGFGEIICGIFSAVVIFYTNSFLMKRRSKELGLYSILGMDKRHISRVVFGEMAISGLVCIGLGLLFGLLFSKLMFLFLLKLLEISTSMAFQIMPKAIVRTLVVFGCTFLVIFITNTIRIASMKPLELLRGSQKGESEPKAKWLWALLGFISLGAGYYIALTTDNPIQALPRFFIAVLLVILGTYLLFVSGSIAILKLLKKSKKFYYQKNHFITVSGLIYRMKQNAVGLSNICILSTAVLVTLSTTVSLYAGMENVIATRMSSDLEVNYIAYDIDEDKVCEDYSYMDDYISQKANEHDLKISQIDHYYEMYLFGRKDNNVFISDEENLSSLMVVSIVCQQDYVFRGGNADLGDDEILVYDASGNGFSNESTIQIGNHEYKVVGLADKKYLNADAFYSGYDLSYIIVNNPQIMQQMSDDLFKQTGSSRMVAYHWGCDLSGNMSDKTAFTKGLRSELEKDHGDRLLTVENVYTLRDEFYKVYGSLFFIGIFIGGLFLITTVMIIYYKQISEGYDDRDRFQILKKVGMSEMEVKKTIWTQILQVFFLPILLAFIHVAFAFDLIKKLLFLLNLTDTVLFAKCSVVTGLVFLVVYVVVYAVTARTYYRIVDSKRI